MSTSSVRLPLVGEHLILTTPAPHVLMMKMNRPRQLNAMSWGMEQDMKKTLDWFEEEPSLWVVILTGNGRAFCAGQVRFLRHVVVHTAFDGISDGHTSPFFFWPCRI